jgi:hypothetical protein
MDQRLQILRHNQEIIHSQQDEPLEEFLDIPVFPPVPNPYASLTPVELATFDIFNSSTSSMIFVCSLLLGITSPRRTRLSESHQGFGGLQKVYIALSFVGI